MLRFALHGHHLLFLLDDAPYLVLQPQLQLLRQLQLVSPVRRTDLCLTVPVPGDLLAEEVVLAGLAETLEVQLGSLGGRFVDGPGTSD